DVHPTGVEVTAAPQPRRIDERDSVEHERVTLPMAHRVPKIRHVKLRVWPVLAAVGRDDAKLAVSATRIAAGIDKDNVVLRLDDASRRALPRDSQRLAGHDRVVLVRPHVELLNFVPVLRLVQWTI